jgi:uncharacterized membrane protein
MQLKLGKATSILNEFHERAVLSRRYKRLPFRLLLGFILFIPISIVAAPALILFSMAGSSRQTELFYVVGTLWLLFVLSAIVIAIISLTVLSIKRAVSRRRYASQRRAKKTVYRR